MKIKKSHKIVFIGIVVLSILLVTAVHAISEAHKTVVIDPHSDYGKGLAAIAEKAIEVEDIDTKYISLGTIYYEAEDTIMVKFKGAKRYSNGVIHSHADLSEDETITFFAADLDSYGVYTYYAQPDNGRIYDKDVVTTTQTFGKGKDYTYNIQNNSIELIDPTTDKVMFVLSNYTISPDSNRTEIIADEINSKYAYAQQPLPINKEKSYIIMDLTMNNEDSLLFIEAIFSKEKLYSLHIEEMIKDFDTTTVSHTVKYYDENGEVILPDNSNYVLEA
jgi:hypothetical protein